MIFFLGDIFAHLNLVLTLVFALRRDMGWARAGAYWANQFTAAVAGALLARAFFGPLGNLEVTRPPASLDLPAVRSKGQP